jgi:secreted protein with Ig-like and vWFA domain
MTITNNDPKLTAFVLGELTDDEAKEIQSAINADNALQTEVEAIRQTVTQIETAMRNEPLPNKIGIAPKRKNRLLRIAAGLSTVAALLFIAVVISHFNTPSKLGRKSVQETEVQHCETSRLDVAADANPEVSASAPTLPALVERSSVPMSETKIIGNQSYPSRDTIAERNFAVPYSGGMNGMQMTVEPRVVNQEAEESVDRFGRPGQIAQFGRPLIAPNKEEDSDSFNFAKDEAYKNYMENDFKPVKVGEFSTFSIDVDTASYSTMRRYIEAGRKVPAESVRLEEFINYFKYDYAQPTDGKPFAMHVDVTKCPWEPKHLLARIGIKGKEYSVEERPPLNLVFLIDVSGSMEASNRLPLVQRGLTELVEMLQTKDRVAIVTYAGESRVALPSVSGQEKRAILDSINSLSAGGSTAGASGIKTAYETARKYYDKEAQNRVILCTDGDFNVGETNNKTLEEMIGDEAKSGVFLTILGFGMGNYKDDRLKTLSMRGNGNYGYIDNVEEARKLLVEGLTGTLFAIAKDVKIQVDFNPAKAAGYRLLGYENRKLRDEDFHNDKADAGEIGAGHTVTALYEIVPAGENVPAAVDKSRYDSNAPTEVTPVRESKESDELMFVKLRYKLPDADKSSLLEYPVKNTVAEITGDSQFAAGVALYGMLLLNSRHSGNGTFDTVFELTMPNTKDDKYRKEFVALVKKAKGI